MIESKAPQAGGAYSGTRQQGASEFRKGIKSYGLLVEPVFKACEFQRFAGRPEVRFLDAMSGPGVLVLGRHDDKHDEPGIRDMLGRELPEIAGRTSFYFNDFSHASLRKLPPDSLTAPCDVRELAKSGFSHSFHIATVRYGIKDLPWGEAQKKALVALRESLMPGGRLVVADMTAYTEHAQQGVIVVHSTKQKLAGRDEATEGLCYIPLFGEWTKLLMDAGFQDIRVTFTGTSDVDTRQWAGQFGPAADDQQMIAKMNEIIRQTCDSLPQFQKEFDVAFNGGAVTLRFPILVISADKPK